MPKMGYDLIFFLLTLGVVLGLVRHPLCTKPCSNPKWDRCPEQVDDMQILLKRGKFYYASKVKSVYDENFCENKGLGTPMIQTIDEYAVHYYPKAEAHDNNWKWNVWLFLKFPTEDGSSNVTCTSIESCNGVAHHVSNDTPFQLYQWMLGGVHFQAGQSAVAMAHDKRIMQTSQDEEMKHICLTNCLPS